MKNIDKILCPIDFSDPSRAALAHAVDLAEHFSARIILFHAISEIDHTPSPSYTLTPQLMDQMVQISHQMKENAEKAMKEMVDNIVPEGIDTRQQVAIGNPADRIVQAAEDEQVDLIVMATHGRSGIKGLIFGSVAEKVVRSAQCPVLTMKHQS